MTNKKRRPKPRKSGARSRKPKFLSLRHQFPANQATDISVDDKFRTVMNKVEYREAPETENVALFFSEGDGCATSLNVLLDGSAAESNSPRANSNSSRAENFSPASPVSQSYREKRAALVKTAMRSRERDASGEKWVRYSEVVERKVKEEEVSSSAVDLRQHRPTEPPLLKLDYEEIMNAWSNKGPLYVEAESSQIVPDINYDVVSHEASNINEVSYGGSVGFWTVPEMWGDPENGEMTREMKMGMREASVLRYKEKRQNRLFHKKIRYQVRKLNAEKRPRIKGRFVKKN